MPRACLSSVSESLDSKKTVIGLLSLRVPWPQAVGTSDFLITRKLARQQILELCILGGECVVYCPTEEKTDGRPEKACGCASPTVN